MVAQGWPNSGIFLPKVRTPLLNRTLTCEFVEHVWTCWTFFLNFVGAPIYYYFMCSPVFNMCFSFLDENNQFDEHRCKRFCAFSRNVFLSPSVFSNDSLGAYANTEGSKKIRFLTSRKTCATNFIKLQHWAQLKLNFVLWTRGAPPPDPLVVSRFAPAFRKNMFVGVRAFPPAVWTWCFFG